MSLIQLDRQSIGVLEEEKASVGIFVYPNRFVGDIQFVKFHCCLCHIIDFKGQMAQSCGLWSGHSWWRRRKREQFDDVVIAQRQIGFVRLSFRAIVFRYDMKAKNLGIEFEASLIVGADDSDVVYFLQIYHENWSRKQTQCLYRMKFV